MTPHSRKLSIAKCAFVSGYLGSVTSCLGLKVGDNIGAVLGVGKTSEGHCVSGCVVSGRFQVLVQVSVGPLLAIRLELSQGTGVAEAVLGGGHRSVDSLEVGSLAVGGKVVAHSAQILESLLSLSCVAGLLFLGSHLLFFLDFTY